MLQSGNIAWSYVNSFTKATPCFQLPPGAATGEARKRQPECFDGWMEAPHPHVDYGDLTSVDMETIFKFTANLDLMWCLPNPVHVQIKPTRGVSSEQILRNDFKLKRMVPELFSLVCSALFKAPFLASSNCRCSAIDLLSTWLSTQSPSPTRNMLLNLLYNMVALSMMSWLALNRRICNTGTKLKVQNHTWRRYGNPAVLAKPQSISSSNIYTTESTFFSVAMSSLCFCRCWVVTCRVPISSNASRHFFTSWWGVSGRVHQKCSFI